MYTSNRVLVVQDAVVLVVVEENRRQRMLCRSVTKGVRLRTFFEDRFFTSRRHEETKGVGLVVVVVVVVVIIIIVVSHSRWSSSSSSSSSYTSRGVCVRDFILRTLSERKKSSNSQLMKR